MVNEFNFVKPRLSSNVGPEFEPSQARSNFGLHRQEPHSFFNSEVHMNAKATVPGQLELGASQPSAITLKDNIIKFMHQRKHSMGTADEVAPQQEEMSMLSPPPQKDLFQNKAFLPAHPVKRPHDVI